MKYKNKDLCYYYIMKLLKESSFDYVISTYDKESGDASNCLINFGTFPNNDKFKCEFKSFFINTNSIETSIYTQ